MSRKKFMATLTAIVEAFKHIQWSTNERSCRQECTLFPFCYPHVFPPLDLFKLRPPRVGEKEDDDQPKNRSSNSHTLGQTSSVDPLAKTDDQDTSAKWECRQSPILMPPRVAKILKQDKHVSTKQRMPKDIWEDRNFMGGLISSLYLELKGCL